ncbi:MAG: hypothetical protein IH823_03605 [Candidatus Dadabacteria bacterium]|nr:hypothetical protein [Candidatus Dadabacteria bacterium]
MRDDHPDAIKLLKGHDFDIVNGKLVVHDTINKYDLSAFIKKLQDNTASLKDMRDYHLNELT